jgi:hypothetical protein
MACWLIISAKVNENNDQVILGLGAEGMKIHKE